MKTLANISRLLVGVLFIISGFIKANDPLGFSYKLDEYFVVFHMEWLSHISLALAILICAAEIGLGVATLMGARMNFTAWSLLLMIIFFTFLTFYSWYFNKVTDCGCFGDALHLTPLQSFEKDLVLLVLILFIFIGRKSISPLLGDMPSTVVSWLGFAGSLFFSIQCYRHLPMIDFRPYKIGKNIQEGMKLPPNAKKGKVEMVFIYKHNGKEVELTTEQISTIDSTYQYVDRKDKMLEEADKPAIHDFTITDMQGSDYTEDILNNPNYYFFLVAYQLDKTDAKVQGKINDFVNLCDQNKIKFIGLTSSSPKEVDAFRHEHNSMFPYYNADATTLKTMIRSNPGLMLLKHGTVIAMWHYNDFPSFDDVKITYLGK